MKIYLIRHGQTAWNKQKKLQGGGIDLDLDKDGMSQAELLKKKLQDVNFDVVISSPMKRAISTAKKIVEDRNIDIIPDERLREREFGEFEGLNKKDFDYEQFWDYFKNTKYEKAESMQNFYARVKSFILDLKKYKYENVLISAHAGICRMFKLYFTNLKYNDGKIESYFPDNSDIIEYII